MRPELKVSGCVCLLALLCLLCCTRSQDSHSASPKYPATVRLKVTVGGEMGYIDATGKLVINPQFEVAQEFSEGLAAVCVGDCDVSRKGHGSRKYGFIDESGKMVINPQFDEAFQFAGGFAPVCLGSGCQLLHPGEREAKWGFIDKSGHFLIEPQFGGVQSFTEDLALVCIGDCYGGSGKWGFIDRTGHFAINPQYDYALSFKNGFALVGVGNADHVPPGVATDMKFGYIDKSGKMIWTPSN